MTNLMDVVERESRLKNENKDCAVRAVSIATDYEYDSAHYVFQLCGRRPRKGTPWEVTEKAVRLLEHRMIDVTHQFESRTVRTLEREMRWVKGKFLVRVYRHVLPVVDGRVFDWTKGRRHRVKAVYKLIEVDNDFHKADLRNLVYTRPGQQVTGRDVTGLYRRIGNRVPPGFTRIILTTDHNGPIFYAA